MKLNTSALRIAFLCVNLLVSLGSASAQEPQTPNLEGIYTLKDPAPCMMIRKTIDDTVKGMVLYKDRARDRLRDADLPPSPRLIIAFTSTEVTITTDPAGPIKTSTDGTAAPATRATDKFQISTKWVNGKLERTFKNDEGKRVNTYSLNGDGTLTMQVTVSAPQLPRPLSYALVYTRTTAGKYDDGFDPYPDCKKDFERWQKSGRVKVRQAAENAEREVKARFNHVKEKILKPENRVPLPQVEVRGYEPQDIINSVQAGKNELVQSLAGYQFAGMRTYVDLSYRIPTLSELSNKEFLSPLVTKRTKTIEMEASLRFIAKIKTLSLNPYTDITINSEPQMADFVMSAGEGNVKKTTTNNLIQHVCRGLWNYTVSKTGYKEINGRMDLVDGGPRLECTFVRIGDPEPAHVCKQN